MPVQACCCGHCANPSMYLFRPSGLILCCGVDTLANVNDVTFPVWPNAQNLYIGAGGNFFDLTGYDGAFNCDPTVTGDGYLELELFAPVSGGSAQLQTVYVRSATYTAPDLSDYALDVFLNGGEDGNIFRYDVSDGVPVVPIPNAITLNNNHSYGNTCSFPDPTIANFVANFGTLEITPICVTITLTGSSGTDGGGTFNASNATVSSAAGSISFSFTAVDDATGGDGEWYAALGVFVGASPVVIIGTPAGSSAHYADDVAFTTATTGSGGDTISFDYDANTTGLPRTFFIEVNNARFTVTQNG